MRAEQIELALMTAELELDGIKTHIDLKQGCPLKGTSIEKKVKKACSAVRSARDILRNDIGSKQRTITTRGGSNRLPLDARWHCPVIPNWKCPLHNRQVWKE